MDFHLRIKKRFKNVNVAIVFVKKSNLFFMGKKINIVNSEFVVSGFVKTSDVICFD